MQILVNSQLKANVHGQLFRLKFKIQALTGLTVGKWSYYLCDCASSSIPAYKHVKDYIENIRT